jgi:hypothetical protein
LLNWQLSRKANKFSWPNTSFVNERIRNLSNRELYGTFVNDGHTTLPQIDTGDYNGIQCTSTGTSVGNYIALQKPNIVSSGLILHLDAGNENSYPGTGTT